jgi:hypothetical protein
MFFDQLSKKKAKAKRSDFFTRILGFPIQRNAGYTLPAVVQYRDSFHARFPAIRFILAVINDYGAYFDRYIQGRYPQNWNVRIMISCGTIFILHIPHSGI